MKRRWVILGVLFYAFTLGCNMVLPIFDNRRFIENAYKGNVHAAGENWYNTDWSYRKLITINKSKVGKPLTNFPVLVYRSADTDLAADAQESGHDICFILYSDNTTKLNHEIESFDGATGALNAWANITRLSGTVDTKIWMYYGNPTCTYQANNESTWNTNYGGVWHLGESTGTFYDSTVNNRDGTISGTATARGVAGIVANSVHLSGTSNYINMGDVLDLDSGSFTVECWIKKDAAATDGLITKYLGSSPWTGWGLDIDANGALAFWSNNDAWDTSTNGPMDSLTVWYYATLTFVEAGVNDNIYYFFNGTYDSTDVTKNPSNGAANLVFGAEEGGGGQFFDGFMDEIRISKVQHNNSWIKTTFNTTSSPTTFHFFGAEESSYTAPTIVTHQPTKNQSKVRGKQKTVYFWVNTTNASGVRANIYTNETGSYVHRQINETAATTKFLHYNYTGATARKTWYYYKVTAWDGTTNVSKWFRFYLNGSYKFVTWYNTSFKSTASNHIVTHFNCSFRNSLNYHFTTWFNISFKSTTSTTKQINFNTSFLNGPLSSRSTTWFNTSFKSTPSWCYTTYFNTSFKNSIAYKIYIWFNTSFRNSPSLRYAVWYNTSFKNGPLSNRKTTWFNTSFKSTISNHIATWFNVSFRNTPSAFKQTSFNTSFKSGPISNRKTIWFNTSFKSTLSSRLTTWFNISFQNSPSAFKQIWFNTSFKSGPLSTKPTTWHNTSFKNICQNKYVSWFNTSFLNTANQRYTTWFNTSFRNITAEKWFNIIWFNTSFKSIVSSHPTTYFNTSFRNTPSNKLTTTFNTSFRNIQQNKLTTWFNISFRNILTLIKATSFNTSFKNTIQNHFTTWFNTSFLNTPQNRYTTWFNTSFENVSLFGWKFTTWFNISFQNTTYMIVYVDDDADPSWYNATHVHTIQEGFDNVSSGGTVYILDGTYTNHGVINKTLSVIGNGSTSILKYNKLTQTAILVNNVNNVNITNITIQGANYSIYATNSNNLTVNYTDLHSNNTYSIYIDDSHFANISHNNISSNASGICLNDISPSALIDDNIINCNNFAIVSYGDANYSTIRYNTIESCDSMIYSSNTTIFNNSFRGGAIPLMILNSVDNLISNNTITIPSSAGIYLSASGRTRIVNNTIESNLTCINLDAGPSWSNWVYNNILIGALTIAIDLGSGNHWNTTKTLSKNIIGGPYIGGNFYSNNTQPHIGDGFSRPYHINGAIIDYYPLIYEGWNITIWFNTSFKNIAINRFTTWFNTSFKNIYNKKVYVDDDAPAAWYNETHVKTIQEGVNNVSEGGTVYVWNGSYAEMVTASKTINLIGNGSSDTFFTSDAPDDTALFVYNSYINISGFTFYDITMANAILVNGAIGDYTEYCIISDCVFNNTDGVQIADFTNNSIIRNNTFTNNFYGLYMEFTWTGEIIPSHLIYNNYFNDNTINIYEHLNISRPDGGQANIYNTTKTLGKNIIGGPYLGGNFYGNNTNKHIGDGFSAPFTVTDGKKDYYPLVYPGWNHTIFWNTSFLNITTNHIVTHFNTSFCNSLTNNFVIWFNTSFLNITLENWYHIIWFNTSFYNISSNKLTTYFNISFKNYPLQRITTHFNTSFRNLISTTTQTWFNISFLNTTTTHSVNEIWFNASFRNLEVNWFPEIWFNVSFYNQTTTHALKEIDYNISFKNICSYKAIIWFNTSFRGTSISWNDNIFFNTSFLNSSVSYLIFSNEYPVNLSTGIIINVILHLTVESPDGYLMNLTWYYGNSSANCTHLLVTDNNVANGTYFHQYLAANSYNTTYYWKVNATDGHSNYEQQTYHYTTASSAPVVIGGGGYGYPYPVGVGVVGTVGILGLIALFYRKKKRRNENE